MVDGALMAVPTFCERNGLTRVSYHYLKRLGRGPAVIVLGTKEMVSPSAEAAWREEMAQKPLRGSLRKLALASEAASAEASAA
jgi:hypothetical protein